jgi:hypothetical protein
MIDIVSAGFHLANVILTSILIYIYYQNYRQMKMTYTLGMITFSGILFIHSLMGLVFDIMMVMYSSELAMLAATVLEGLKTAAFLILIKLSLD